jgi:hypothetical protein
MILSVNLSDLCGLGLTESEVQWSRSPKAGWPTGIWHPDQFPKLGYSAKMLLELNHFLFIKR